MIVFASRIASGENVATRPVSVTPSSNTTVQLWPQLYRIVDTGFAPSKALSGSRRNVSMPSIHGNAVCNNNPNL